MVQPVYAWDPSPNSTRDAILFLLYMAIAAACGGISLYIARRRNEFAGFMLFPCLCTAIFYDNLTLAVVALTGRSAVVPQGMLRLQAAVQSFIIPLFITTEFELSYAVHKKRSANFFFGCIRFDSAGSSGSRGGGSSGSGKPGGTSGRLVRYCVWLLAIAVMLIQVVVNGTFMADPGQMDTTTRFTNKSLGIGRTAGGSIDWSDAVDFFPFVYFLAFSLYFGISLWR